MTHSTTRTAVPRADGDRPLGAGAELYEVLTLVAPALRGSAAALWRPEGLRARYGRYLAAMHCVVRASVPLMEQALDRCRDAGAGDRARQVLAARLPGHIADERDHDAWLVRDMAAAGLQPGAEVARLPSRTVAQLVGAQMYWVAHHHPICLLGYIAVLELHAPEPGLAELLADRTGLPAAAFTTVREHARLDGGHSRAVLDMLDEAEPPPGLRRAVRLSALHTARALLGVLDGLHEHRPNRKHQSGSTRPAAPDRT